MGAEIYTNARSSATGYRFRKSHGSISRIGHSPVLVEGYRLAGCESHWLIHRLRQNDRPAKKGWSVTHTGIGSGIGHTFETLDSAKSFVLSLSQSTATQSTPALDASPFGQPITDLEALVELRLVRDIFEVWRIAAQSAAAARKESVA